MWNPFAGSKTKFGVIVMLLGFLLSWVFPDIDEEQKTVLVGQVVAGIGTIWAIIVWVVDKFKD